MGSTPMHSTFRLTQRLLPPAARQTLNVLTELALGQSGGYVKAATQPPPGGCFI